MTGPDHAQPQPGPDAGLDDLQADIERTRAELGQTAQALTDKLDVKGRAVGAAADAKDAAIEKVGAAKKVVVEHTTNADGSVRSAVPSTAAAVVAVVAVIVGVILWRRR
ncbi:hypothetical protein TUM20985_53220 [Mycobacterium antarcticum]|uniref:DUF3618 domain-containing protein n=1 Tax=unclassified Mycolicibacterium TaxID=2636767 RepID=UPI0023A0630F|nr:MULTISPECIES: DUF3618 domain-containing protein [unclassified Mycolicibacterium]BDX34775.1 hypothetical protein TUM20985_53220 [Mycolicibacterium sp. TUM20985]GLP81621.1 hypothetical protein TUM20984_30410 [Mycolicibacterium sp. TUM20984]